MFTPNLALRQNPTRLCSNGCVTMSSCVSHCDCVRSLRDIIGYCSLMHTAADKKVQLDTFSVAVEVFFVFCLFLWAGAKTTAAKTLGLIKKEWKTLCFHRRTGFGVNAT